MQSNDPSVKDVCSGLFNSALGVGVLIAPILGSYIYEAVNMSGLCEIMTLIGVVYIGFHAVITFAGAEK